MPLVLALLVQATATEPPRPAESADAEATASYDDPGDDVLRGRAMAGGLLPADLEHLEARTDAAAARVLVVHYQTQGQDSKATRMLEEVYRRDPQDADAVFRLVLVAHMDGRHGDALAWANTATKLEPHFEASVRSQRLLTVHQVAARSAAALGDPSASAHAKAFIALATRLHARVPEDLKQLGR